MSIEVTELESDVEPEVIQQAKRSDQTARLLEEIGEIAQVRGTTDTSAVHVRDEFDINGTRVDFNIDVRLSEAAAPREYDTSELRLFQYRSRDSRVTETTGYLLADDLLLWEYYTDQGLMPELEATEYNGRVELDEVKL